MSLYGIQLETHYLTDNDYNLIKVVYKTGLRRYCNHELNCYKPFQMHLNTFRKGIFFFRTQHNK